MEREREGGRIREKKEQQREKRTKRERGIEREREKEREREREKGAERDRQTGRDEWRETHHKGVSDAQTNEGRLYVACNPCTKTSNSRSKHQQAAHVVLKHVMSVSISFMQ